MLYDGYAPKEEQVDDAYESTGQPVVFCKDCRHYFRSFGMFMAQIEARCNRTAEVKIDLVTGRIPKPEYIDMNKCVTMRRSGSDCGPIGRFWVPKKSTPKTTMLLLKRTGNETD